MAVCIKHKRAFGTKLRLEPARIEPLTFTVVKDKWFTEKGNQQPPRLQSQVKDKAIWDQVHELEDLKVVVPCFPRARSQVLLVKKLNDEYRMCVDYRGLNEAIPSYGGAIPHIPDMLQRLGKQRPTRFSLMNLKNGYWQTPLNAQAKLIRIAQKNQQKLDEFHLAERKLDQPETKSDKATYTQTHTYAHTKELQKTQTKKAPS